MHVFVDESERRGTYFLCASAVDPAEVAYTRRLMQSLVMPGERRIHAVKERPHRLKMICGRIRGTGVHVHIYVSKAPSSTTARTRCLDAMTIDMTAQGASRLVVEMMDGFVHTDVNVINSARKRSGAVDRLRYDHVRAFEEPLLWISDCVAWAFGRDTTWRKLVEPLIDKVVDVDP